MGRFFVGTSGWSYRSWKGDFYPADLPTRRYLAFYAQRFDSTEVNYSFYHLPRTETYERWATQVSDRFVFALKASRLITHVKRLSRIGDAWETFVHRAQALGPRRGPILLQFPASFRSDPPRLSRFLQHARRPAPRATPLKLVFEFRHASWFTDDVYALLRRHRAACCIADSPQYPRDDVVTADFVYLRFHGRTELFTSSYSDQELAEEATHIRHHLRQGLDVYAYFNNDAKGHAVRNADTLRRMVEGRDR